MGNLSAELPKGVYADAWALPGNEFFLSILQLLYLSAQRETKQNVREYIHVSRVIVQLKTPNQYICRVQLLCIISLGRKKGLCPGCHWIAWVVAVNRLSDEQHRNYRAIYKKSISIWKMGFYWNVVKGYHITTIALTQFLTIFLNYNKNGKWIKEKIKYNGDNSWCFNMVFNSSKYRKMTLLMCTIDIRWISRNKRRGCFIFF